MKVKILATSLLTLTILSCNQGEKTERQKEVSAKKKNRADTSRKSRYD